MVDTGLGMAVFQIFKKEDEDRRVLLAALRAVCNIVNEFSPLRPVGKFCHLSPARHTHSFVDISRKGSHASACSTYRRRGINTPIECSMGSEEPSSEDFAGDQTRRDETTPLETASRVCVYLGFYCIRIDSSMFRLLDDPDDEVLEQALNIVRNIGEDESGIDITFQELGSDLLLNRVTMSLGSSDDNVVLQVGTSGALLIPALSVSFHLGGICAGKLGQWTRKPSGFDHVTPKVVSLPSELSR